MTVDTTAITNEDLLSRVKELLDYGENDLDDTKLKYLIDDAKNFLRASGVDELLVNSVSAVTVIAHYVESGITPFVEQRTTQLRMWKNV